MCKTMESVAAKLMLTDESLGQCVGLRDFRQPRVESGIKYRHLHDGRTKGGSPGRNPFQRRRVMQRRETSSSGDVCFNVSVQSACFRPVHTTMNHPMGHEGNITYSIAFKK